MAYAKRVTLVGDFETTTYLSYLKDGYVRVWAYALASVETGKVVRVGNSLDEFMDYVLKKKLDIYFHNLKFDGEFIVYWLLNHGYKYSENREEKTFNGIISDMGQWYQIEVIHKRFKKNIVSVVFKDSLKKLPLKVKSIAKAFKLEESKLEIDYDEYREVGHELTKQEYGYVCNDVIIVAKALKMELDEGMDGLTIGSDSINEFKGTIGGKKNFKSLFPILNVEVDDVIRKAYKGGFVYCNPKYAGKEFKGVSYDVNSLYPSRMYYDLLPYGMPIRFEGKYEQDDVYPLYIYHLSCYFKVKKNHLPTIQLKGNMLFKQTEYITDSKEIVEMWMTSVDYELMLEHYNVENLEIYGGFKFRGCKTLFRDFIDKWMEVKANSSGGKRQLAKLQLNNLYGKFATNPRRAKKEPRINEEGIVEYVIGEDELTKPVYTALGAFVTAYARAYTIRAAQKNYNRFLYADTDSIHLIGYEEAEGIEIHDSKLGCWKNEGYFERGKFIRAKTYVKVKNGELHVTCAGMPENVKEDVTFDGFHEGQVYEGKLMPKRVKGGIVLIPSEFTIK